jgi:hypothetical protein
VPFKASQNLSQKGEARPPVGGRVAEGAYGCDRSVLIDQLRKQGGAARPERLADGGRDVSPQQRRYPGVGCQEALPIGEGWRLVHRQAVVEKVHDQAPYRFVEPSPLSSDFGRRVLGHPAVLDHFVIEVATHSPLQVDCHVVLAVCQVLSREAIEQIAAAFTGRIRWLGGANSVPEVQVLVPHGLQGCQVRRTLDILG